MTKLFIKFAMSMELKTLVFILASTMLPAIAFAENKPERIVSMSPSLTEIVFAIGAGAQVVAVDNYSDYPPEAPITSLSAFEPNLEAIATFDPDLVILSYDIGDLVKGLNLIGVDTMLLPAAKNFNGILDQVRDLGEKTGNIQQANKLSEQMGSKMNNLIETRKNKDSLRIYHEIDDNYYSASSHSFIGNIYKLLNFINIADQADKDGYGYPKLSPEYILLSNPEMIILTGTNPEKVEKIKKRPGWSNIDAIKKENVFILDPDIGSRWGPRIIDFASFLVKKLNSSQQ